ncbi:translation initiation factor IF-2-like [Sorex araneus]|uniref:translation initiation factor IF-2-like n=1 Tax=Sorex araneus TaxID=42254 RepID=UPI002433A52B|nr:translation initiation factor IF-2-like [Sorex araneus]
MQSPSDGQRTERAPRKLSALQRSGHSCTQKPPSSTHPPPPTRPAPASGWKGNPFKKTQPELGCALGQSHLQALSQLSELTPVGTKTGAHGVRCHRNRRGCLLKFARAQFAGALPIAPSPSNLSVPRESRFGAATVPPGPSAPFTNTPTASPPAPRRAETDGRLPWPLAGSRQEAKASSSVHAAAAARLPIPATVPRTGLAFPAPGGGRASHSAPAAPQLASAPLGQQFSCVQVTASGSPRPGHPVF